MAALTAELEALLSRAVDNARARGHRYVTTEHVLHAVVDTPRGAEVLAQAGGDVARIRAANDDFLRREWRFQYLGTPAELAPDPRLASVLQRAATRMAAAGVTPLTLDALIAELYLDEPIRLLLVEHGAERLAVREYISHGIATVSKAAAPLPRAWLRRKPASVAPVAAPATRAAGSCRVILHNDNYTTREFVVAALTLELLRSAADAETIMREVHEHGTGVAGIYPDAIAFAKVAAVTQRARERGYPLRLSTEPVDEAPLRGHGV